VCGKRLVKSTTKRRTPWRTGNAWLENTDALIVIFFCAEVVELVDTHV
jgi:hypothetical protein